MEEKIKNAVKEYQCPGCVCDCTDLSLYINGSVFEYACKKHVSGTTLSNIGKIFLGLPKGFCRLGFQEKMSIHIFKDMIEHDKSWAFDRPFNIPVWKYKNEFNHILIKGFQPRLNQAFYT